GCMPVPKSLVESRIPSLTPTAVAAARRELALQFGSHSKAIPEAETAIRAILQGDRFPVHFVYDRRPVVVKEVRVEEGSLTVVFAPPTSTAVRPRPVTQPK